MIKKRFYFVDFPMCSEERSLVESSYHVLRKVGSILQMFETYIDESYDQTPWQIWNHMTENNENLFRVTEPDEHPEANISRQKQETEEPKYSCLPISKLKFYDKTNKVLQNEESGYFRVKSETLHHLTENSKMDFCSTEDVEMEISLIDGREEVEEVRGNIRDLIRRNLVQVTSISIIRLSEKNIVVEIEFYLPSSSEKPKHQSSISENTNNSDRVGKKSKLPPSCPSKRIKCEDLPVTRDSGLIYDISNSSVLNFLVQRLISILSYRKTCTEQINRCFQKFLNELLVFSSFTKDLKNVVKKYPMAKEGFESDDESFRNNVMFEVDNVLKQAESITAGVKFDASIWRKCLRDINMFEKSHISSKHDDIKDFSTSYNIKEFESHLKEICEEVENTFILSDGRRKILLEIYIKYECLIENFVKFLIVTGILMPPPFFYF